ncbi:MAG TPA: hypothetical protein DDZ39_09110 [Flavobacteriaceae bacterium]|jgi:hypothetical protein|nr:hypothetical protein [Flavobacteriaceae bacterium]HBS11346.1 hypothetical protein [Flavobacteriaceae bacterium]
MKIITKINIGQTTPTKMFAFLLNLNKKKYLEWHKDHLDFKWISKTEKIVKSKIFLKEKISFFTVSDIWEVVAYKPNSQIKFKSTTYNDRFFSLHFEKNKNVTFIIQTIEIQQNNKKWYIEYNPFIFLFSILYKKHTFQEYSKLNL